MDWRDRFRFAQPYIAALLVAIGLLAIALHKDSYVAILGVEQRDTLYSALATVFGSLFGFVIAAVAIVLTVVNSKTFKKFRTLPAYDKMWKIFTRCIWLLGLSTLVCLVSLVVDTKNSEHLWLFVLAVGSSVWAAMSLISVVQLIEQIVLSTRELE